MPLGGEFKGEMGGNSKEGGANRIQFLGMKIEIERHG